MEKIKIIGSILMLIQAARFAYYAVKTHYDDVKDEAIYTAAAMACICGAILMIK